MKTKIQTFFALFIIAFSFSINSSYSQSYSTVKKNCGSCQGIVSATSKIGDYCPHCGVRWGYENTTKRETQSNTTTRFNKLSNSYMVIQSRAYFHTKPSSAYRKNSYLVYGEVITAKYENNGYMYTSYVNDGGQTTKGWVSKALLIQN